jgi:prevent-host-death family protein
MTKRFSIAEARANLPTIVNQAEAGDEIELTRHGKPVAVVVSLRELERLRGGRRSFGESYRKFLASYPLEETGLDTDVFAATRDRNQGRKVDL